MRIAAIGDIHCTADYPGLIKELLGDIETKADVLVMAGDLTNTGLIEEMQVFVDGLADFSLPKVAVMGNHDHESDQVELLMKMMTTSGIIVLDSSVCEIDGVGFVGTKGFCGGFDDRRVRPFGESALKAFIQTTVEEVVRLENALERLGASRKVAILHFAPVRETLQGESPELYPFLGSSLFADALDRHAISFAVHGHAHHGSLQGFTPKKIPVYNVARFVLSRFTGTAYRLITI